MAHGLEAIDWAAPWLLPWRELGEDTALSTSNGLSVAAALNAIGQAP